MTFPALATAAEDRTLKGMPFCVYGWLLCHRLDFEDYCSLKIDGLAQTLQMAPRTASRAVRLLVEGGYIERRLVPGKGYGYRLRMRKYT